MWISPALIDFCLICLQRIWMVTRPSNQSVSSKFVWAIRRCPLLAESEPGDEGEAPFMEHEVEPGTWARKCLIATVMNFLFTYIL